MAQGFLGHIGFAPETTWGTPVAATDYFEAMSESLNAEIDRFPVVNIRAGYEEPLDEDGLIRISGDVSLNGNPVTIGHLLKGALQTKSVTIVASGFLWTNHFMSIKTGDEFSTDTPFQPYTYEVFRDVTSSVQYAGCVVDTLTMNYQPNQDVRFTASLLGKSQASIAATTPTFVNSPVNPFTFDTASFEIGGAANSKLEALTLTIRNNLEGVPLLNGTKQIGRIAMSDFQMVELSGTLDFTNLDEYDDFIAQTETTFKTTVTKASSFAMTVDIPKFVYTAFPTGIGGRERLSVDFQGKAFYHPGSKTSIMIDLTTTNSAY